MNKSDLRHCAANRMGTTDRMKTSAGGCDAHHQLHRHRQPRQDACEDVERCQLPLEWNDFQSVAAFFVCIREHSAISRLRTTQALPPESSQKILDKHDKFLGFKTKNFSLYRRHLENLNDRCVPFISVPGKDTTFTIDGEQWTYDADANEKSAN